MCVWEREKGVRNWEGEWERVMEREVLVCVQSHPLSRYLTPFPILLVIVPYLLALVGPRSLIPPPSVVPPPCWIVLSSICTLVTVSFYSCILLQFSRMSKRWQTWLFNVYPWSYHDRRRSTSHDNDWSWDPKLTDNCSLYPSALESHYNV
jgi:hypothetical protein